MPGVRQPLTLDLKKIAILSWRMLVARERIHVLLLAVGMTINGALQSFSLAALLPFIGLLLDPLAVQGNGYLASLSHFFGDPDPHQFLVWCALGLFAAIALKCVVDFVYTYSLNQLVAVVERRVAVELLGKCMAAPYVWFLSKNTSILVKQVMGDIVIWARAGLKSVLSLISSAITLGSIMVLLVSINPVFGISLALAGALFSMTIMRLIRPYVRKLAVMKHNASDEAYIVVNHSLVGAKDIKVASKESFFVGQFARQYQSIVSNSAKLATVQPIPIYVIEIAVALALVMVGIYVSSHTGLRSEMVALLAVYGVAVIRVLPVFNQISGTVNTIHGAVPAIETIHRIESELDVLTAAGGEISEADAIGVWKRLELKDVVYGYPEGKGYALNGITLTINHGVRLGIVGRSGSGKTTLVDILTGLLTPVSGRVMVGRWELEAGNASSWRRQIGYVPQHPFIADESLRFNVALDTDHGTIDDRKVLEALETANFGDVLRQELHEGLDAQLGERGLRLSGGQRQRVAIARALYRNPSLLILDEATSALDSESERTITDALSKISRDKTILVVAHRLSTVKNCDKIVVLEKGRVVGYDSHANLIRDCPLYRKFVELGDLSLDEPEIEWDQRTV